MAKEKQIKFLLKNLFRGLIYTLIIAVAYVLFREFIIEEDRVVWLERFYTNPTLIYLIYVGSEVFFGLIPPEFFMLWAYNHHLDSYFMHVLLFAAISYGAGIFGFLVGRFLQKSLIFKRMGQNFYQNYSKLFKKYGSALIIAAALTPIPWAAVSILVGTTDYRFKRYLKMALFRILRFFVYGYIIFQTHQF